MQQTNCAAPAPALTQQRKVEFMAKKKAGATYPFREAAETARHAAEAWTNYAAASKLHQMQDHSEHDEPPPPPPWPARAAK